MWRILDIFVGMILFIKSIGLYLRRLLFGIPNRDIAWSQFSHFFRIIEHHDEYIFIDNNIFVPDCECVRVIASSYSVCLSTCDVVGVCLEFGDCIKYGFACVDIDDQTKPGLLVVFCKENDITRMMRSHVIQFIENIL